MAVDQKRERARFVCLLRSTFYSQINVPPREITSFVHSQMGSIADEDNEMFRRRVRKALNEMPEATYNKSSRLWSFSEVEDPEVIDLTSPGPGEGSQKREDVWEKIVADLEEMICILGALETAMKAEVNLPQLLDKPTVMSPSSSLVDATVSSPTSVSSMDLIDASHDIDLDSGGASLLSMESTPIGLRGGATRLGDHDIYISSKFEPFLADVARCPKDLELLVEQKRAKLFQNVNEHLPIKKRERSESPYRRSMHLKSHW